MGGRILRAEASRRPFGRAPRGSASPRGHAACDLGTGAGPGPTPSPGRRARRRIANA